MYHHHLKSWIRQDHQRCAGVDVITLDERNIHTSHQLQVIGIPLRNFRQSSTLVNLFGV